MSLMGLRAESSGMPLSNDRPPFIKWQKNSRIRIFGNVQRRWQHFVNIKMPDGTEKRTALSCSNYDYNKPELTELPRSERDCIICEIYDHQIQGKVHPEIDFVSFPPNFFNKDKPPVKYSFQANMLCFDREVQEVDLAGSVSIISFRLTNWNEIMGWIPPTAEEAESGFYRGDPTDPETGYDIKISYFADKSGSDKYSLDYQLTNSPLTDEEKQAISDRNEVFKLNEYYKKKTRDEQIQFLYDVYGQLSSGNAPKPTNLPWDNNQSSSSANETDEVAGEIAKLMENS